MTYRVVIEATAEVEFAEAVAFYESREPGLGLRFAREVRKVFQEVARDPERFPRVCRRTRKARIHSWPYSVYFALKPQSREVIISAVWHGARDPARLRGRLR